MFLSLLKQKKNHNLRKKVSYINQHISLHILTGKCLYKWHMPTKLSCFFQLYGSLKATLDRKHARYTFFSTCYFIKGPRDFFSLTSSWLNWFDNHTNGRYCPYFICRFLSQPPIPHTLEIFYFLIHRKVHRYFVYLYLGVITVFLLTVTFSLVRYFWETQK